MTPDAVLRFWLSETPPDKRFARDDALDAAIRDRFGALHTSLARAVPDDWRATPDARLAAVIALDQFSRNLHRDDPRAYAQDAAALALTRESLAAGDDRRRAPDDWPVRTQFVLLPLMHAENAATQAESVGRFEALARDAAGTPHAEAAAGAADFARRHAAVIARFGRFPSRNAALGRDTTLDEAAHLAANPHGF